MYEDFWYATMIREIVDAIEIYLLNEGYEVAKAYDRQAGDRMSGERGSASGDYGYHDAGDGRDTRRDEPAGIKQYTSDHALRKTEDHDKILGLNAGADDYLGKPFNPLELLARVKSQLRRYTVLGSMETMQDVWTAGGLVLDDLKKR